MAAPFEYAQAQEIASQFRRFRVRYLFIGKSGAVILGFPDTTQDEVEGMRVCHIDDIIRSKEATGRVKDRESLPRLRAFRDWLRARQ